MTRSGFGAVGDEAFRALVLARIVEPTSKLDTVRVLDELGVGSPSRVTFMRCLKRVVAARLPVGDRRRPATGTRPAPAGWRWCSTTSRTLYFETPREDGLRKVGMSKERRVDPQVCRRAAHRRRAGSRWPCTCSRATRPKPRP